MERLAAPSETPKRSIFRYANATKRLESEMKGRAVLANRWVHKNGDRHLLADGG